MLKGLRLRGPRACFIHSGGGRFMMMGQGYGVKPARGMGQIATAVHAIGCKVQADALELTYFDRFHGTPGLGAACQGHMI